MPQAAGAVAGVRARSLLDGRGQPALEAEVALAGGAIGRAIVASWRARGDGAAANASVALLDGGAAFSGFGLEQAIGFVHNEIARAITGRDATNGAGVDVLLGEVLGGGRRAAQVSRPGANATLAVSIAAARAAAQATGRPLSLVVAPAARPPRLPMPIVDVVEADPRYLGLARVALVPLGAERLADAIDWCAEVVREAAASLQRMGAPLGISAQGAWISPFEEPLQAILFVTRAIEQAGFTPGEDISLAVDVSAGAFGSGGAYVAGASSARLDTRAMIERALGWLQRAPIAILEDALAPDAGAAWPELVRASGSAVRIVMREALLGAPARILQAAEAEACGGACIVAGRLPTVSAVAAAVNQARHGRLEVALASGERESEDTWLAELAVALSADYLSAGGLLGAERTAKWNACRRLSALTAENDSIVRERP